MTVGVTFFWIMLVIAFLFGQLVQWLCERPTTSLHDLHDLAGEWEGLALMELDGDIAQAYATLAGELRARLPQ